MQVAGVGEAGDGTETHRGRTRSFLAGLVGAPVLILALSALSVRWWPHTPGPGTLGRLLDNLMPQMALSAILGCGVMAALGAPRWATGLALASSLAGFGLTVEHHLARSVPLAPHLSTDLTVLWFNVLAQTTTRPEVLAAAVSQSPADLVILAEAPPLAGMLAELGRVFPAHAGCPAPDDCGLLVLSRDPSTRIDIRRIGRTGEPRLAVVEVTGRNGRKLTVVGAHLFKPWFFGIVEGEDWMTLEAISGLSGPVVVVGDLNAAPWSRRLARLVDQCGLAWPRRPLPTWPNGAGIFGLPLDHVLVHEARLSGVEPWGAGLGSNHLGLLARISTVGAQEGRPIPAGCLPG